MLMCGASSSSFTRATVRAGESAWGRCSLMRASTNALARRRMQRLKQVATGRVYAGSARTRARTASAARRSGCE